MNLTINDFRNILGKTNDGNVVFTEDDKLQKVNHGGLLSRKIHGYATAANDATMNVRVRQAFYAAISTSIEARAMTPDALKAIAETLGVSGPHTEDIGKPLTRRMISEVLDRVGQAVHPMALIGGEKFAIHQLGTGILDMKKADQACAALNAAMSLDRTTPEATARLFRPNEFGHTRKEYAAFIRGNDAVIKMLAFDRLYWQAMEGKPMDGAAAYRASLIDLMKGYAKGKLPVPKADRLASLAKPPAVQVPADLQARFDAVSKTVTDQVTALTADMPKGSYAKLLTDALTAHLTSAMKQTFVSAFEANRNDPNAADIAERAYRAQADGLSAMLRGVLEVKAAWQTQPGGSTIPFASVLLRLIDEKFTQMAVPYDTAKPEELVDVMLELTNGLAEFSASRLATGYCETMLTDPATRETLQQPFVEKIMADANPVDLNALRVAFIKTKLGLPDPGLDRAEEAVMAYLGRQLDVVRKSVRSPEEVQRQQEAAITSIFAVCQNDPAVVIRRTIGWPRAENLGISKHSRLVQGGEAMLRAELAQRTPEELQLLVTYAQADCRSNDDALEVNILRVKNGMPAIQAAVSGGKGLVKSPILTALQNGLFKPEMMNEAFCRTMRDILAGGLRLSAAQNDGEDEEPKTGSTFFGNALKEFPADQACALTCAMAERLIAKVAEAMDRSSGDADLIRENKAQYAEFLAVKDDPNALVGMKAKLALDVLDQFGIHVWGFGVSQFDEMMPLLTRCGVTLESFASTDLQTRAVAIEKVLTLMTAAQLNGQHIDELPEFIERMTGRPVTEVRVEDLADLVVKRKLGIKIVDPNTALKGDEAKLPDALRGVKKFSEVGAKVADIAALHKAIAAFRRDGRAEVTMFGATGVLVRRADGEIDLKVGEKALFHIGDSLDRLQQIAEDELVSRAAQLTTPAEKESLVAVLPPVPQPGSATNLLRARELYVKTIAAKLNVLTSTLSSVPTARLHDMAVEVMKSANPPNFPELSAKPSEQFNSEEMVEMHRKMLDTSAAVVDAKVQMPKVASVRSPEERQAAPFDGATARKILADLFMNQDTWSFDAISKNPNAPKGDRVRNILSGYGPELAHLKGVVADEEKLATVVRDLPPVVREELTAILKELVRVDFQAMTPADFAALEDRVAGSVKRIMIAMQTMVSSMFKAKANQAAAEPWQQSLKDVGGTSVGIDTTTAQGLFVKGVIDTYFTGSQPVDQRAMLAAFLRNTDGTSSEGKQVAELLKGAGPLLQKTLQGLPLESFPPETQVALKDMKSKLASIPEDAVRAQLLELVDSSNGRIRSIEVKKSAGAASVAQTFICNLKTADCPVEGIDCVVKVLRPNAQTAIRREKVVFDKVLAANPRLAAMKNPFEGQFREILKELDFTLEAKNVEMGAVGYERPDLGQDVSTERLHSMQLMKGCVPTMGAMVVSKASGQTVDAYIGETLETARNILRPITTTTQLGADGPQVTVCHAANANEMGRIRQQLEDLAQQTLQRRQELAKVLDAWFTRALYRDGFFHADMHAGNIMTAPDATTLIDFGNCMRLSEIERDKLKFIVLACRLGEAGKFEEHFKAVLPKDAQAAFSTAYSDHRAEFEEIFRKGSPNDMVPRLFAAMSRLHELGVAVPATLYAFTQSYGRLAAAVTGMDKLLVSLQTMGASVGVAPVSQVRLADDAGGSPRIAQLFQKLMDVGYCTHGGTCTVSALRTVRDEIKDYLRSEEGKADLRAMAADPEQAKKLRDLLDNLEKQSIVKGMVERRFWIRGNDLSKMIDAAVAHNEQSPDYAAAQTELPEQFVKLAEQYCNHLNSALSDEIAEQSTPEEILAQATVREMAALMDNELAAAAFATSYAGLLGILSIKGRIGAATDLVERIAGLETSVKGDSVRQNSAFPPEIRLTGLQLDEVQEIRRNDFRAPSDDRFTKTGWHKEQAKVDLMIRVLTFNLERLAKGLKVPEGEPIPEGAIRIAFGEFGRTYRTGDFARTLTEEAKNALRARAEGNPALRQAIDALPQT